MVTGYYKTPEAIEVGYDNTTSSLAAENVQEAIDEIISNTSGIILKNVDCVPSVFVGAVVRISGSVAVNALADSIANSNVLGICVSKSSSVLCDIRVSGLTESVLSGLNEANEYYLSDTVAGELTTTIPVTTNHVVFKIGVPFNATQLVIDKGTRMVRS